MNCAPSKSALGRAAPAQIAAEQGELGRLRDVDAGILQQRGQIVGGRPHHGILEIQDAEPRQALAVRQPQAGWANGSRAAPRSAAPRWRAPAPRPTAARNSWRGVVRHRRVEARQVPVEQQLDLDQERVQVVGRNAIFEMRRDRQQVGKLLARAAPGARRPRSRSAPRSGPAARPRPRARRPDPRSPGGPARDRRDGSRAPAARTRASPWPWPRTAPRSSARCAIAL